MLGTVGVSFVMFAPFVFQFLTEGEPHRLIVVEHYSLCVALFCVLGISYLLSSPPISPAVLPFLQASQYNKYVRDKLSRTNKKKKTCEPYLPVWSYHFQLWNALASHAKSAWGWRWLRFSFVGNTCFPRAKGVFRSGGLKYKWWSTKGPCFTFGHKASAFQQTNKKAPQYFPIPYNNLQEACSRLQRQMSA